MQVQAATEAAEARAKDAAVRVREEADAKLQRTIQDAEYQMTKELAKAKEEKEEIAKVHGAFQDPS